jgi:SAM-dependent methyltransferase
LISRPPGIARRLLPRALRGYLRRHLPRPPMNFRLRDSSPAAIDADVCYALQVAQAYLDILATEGIDPDGKVILELGPGINFGSAVLLACHGALSIVADRFLANWDPAYHPRFYAALRNAVAGRGAAADLTPLDRLIEHNGYSDGEIRRVWRGAEDLQGVAESSVDIVFSNAVLEHLFDLPAACRELGRISKPFAWGLHQVDFRDHRDFARPLEYLLLADEKFRRMFVERHGECGSQWRPPEMAQFFETAGFEVIRFEANMTAEEEYLREFEPRLRKAASRYRDMPISELRTLGGRFLLRRRPLRAADWD